MTDPRMLKYMGRYLLLVVMLLFASTGTSAWAEVAYIVHKGDSLYRISKKFKADIEIIKTANELSSSKLIPGMKLIIPTNEQGTGTNVKGTPLTHKVKKGDSLWEIGRKYSVSVKDLKELNNLKTNKLKPEQQLLLQQKPSHIETVAGLPLLQEPIHSVTARETIQLQNVPVPQNSKMKEFFEYITEQTLGIPYKFGSSSMKGTDCSGYVQRVFNFINIKLPRSAREQFTVGESVNKDDLSIGDLVFFRTYAPFASHVGIYLGNDLFVHASSLARKVTIDNLNTPYYIKRFIGAKRLFGFDDVIMHMESIPQTDLH